LAGDNNLQLVSNYHFTSSYTGWIKIIGTYLKKLLWRSFGAEEDKQLPSQWQFQLSSHDFVYDYIVEPSCAWPHEVHPAFAFCLL
jgi:hypothetical protein